MGFGGIWQWIIVLVIVLILFGGRGKISAIMGDLGKGVRNLKSGLEGEGESARKVASKGTSRKAPKTAKKKKAAKKKSAKKKAAKKKV